MFFLFLYVRNVLSSETIDVKVTDDSKEKTVEVKPVNVTLIVESSNYYAKYQERMDNVNTFDYFLENLRDHKNFYFEKTEYTYGTEYEKVNNLKIPDGYSWHIYVNNQEITHKTSGKQLENDAVYKMILEKN